MTSKREQTELSGAWRAVWRWHFYAGVLVLPFLMLMALTGGLYLFKTEIDGLAHGRMARVAPAERRVSPDRWIASAEQRSGGRATDLVLPARTDQAVRVNVDLTDGGRRTVFVDPHDGRVTGVTSFGGVMETIKGLHSLSAVGGWANYLVEIVAGWAIVLVATGLFLWWPRGPGGGVLTLRAAPREGRPFWRDLHAVAGAYAAAVIAILVVTGMPWSAVWGDRIMGYVRDHGLGRPAPPAVDQAFVHAAHGQAPAGVGWTMEGMVLPTRQALPRGVAALVEAAARAGLARPYVLSLPQGDAAATAANQPDRVEDTRILYLEPHSGRILADVGYEQFGPGAKAFEWGIAVHQGTQYGWLNRYLMLAGCIAIWVLAISGLVMWWKRRPPKLSAARLGAPVAPPGARVRAAVLGLVLPLAVLYPLTGVSLVIALVLDRLVQRLLARLRRRPA